MTKAFSRCEDKVLERFSALTSERKVFRQADLSRFLRDQSDSWDIRHDTRVSELIEFLVAKHALEVVNLASENDYAPIKRFSTPGASPFELALSLRAGSYLCHATAVFLHNLTEQVPQTIYVNREQSKKPKPTGSLSQDSLDRAFRSRQRSSRYVFVHGRNRFVILSGKNTGDSGVGPVSTAAGQALRATNLERTLVDITVRPSYGGGVHEILKAFRSALDRLSFSKLVATLRTLDHVYPYHQALGFYLERAGAPAQQLERLRSLGLKFDFYLSHEIKNPKYDKRWQLYYPGGL